MCKECYTVIWLTEGSRTTSDIASIGFGGYPGFRQDLVRVFGELLITSQEKYFAQSPIYKIIKHLYNLWKVKTNNQPFNPCPGSAKRLRISQLQPHMEI